MATIQVRLDDSLKIKADKLFSSLGLDTSTAVRIFLNISVENNGLPFSVKHTLPADLQEAVYDSRNLSNLNGPYDTAEAAVLSMLED